MIFNRYVLPNDKFRFVSVNKAFLKSTGLTEKQVVGKTTAEVIPDSSHSLVINSYKKSIQDKQVVTWVERSNYPSGERIGVVSIAPVFDANEQCIHLIGSVKDITAEERLKEREAELRRSQRRSKSGTWEYHIRTSENRWSHELYTLYGYEHYEIEPTYEFIVNHILHSDNKKIFDTVLSDILEGNDISEFCSEF